MQFQQEMPSSNRHDSQNSPIIWPFVGNVHQIYKCLLCYYTYQCEQNDEFRFGISQAVEGRTKAEIKRVEMIERNGDRAGPREKIGEQAREAENLGKRTANAMAENRWFLVKIE